MREAQAIFLFIEKPEAFIQKKCDTCHNFFLTTYQFVSVCSTACRIKSLEEIGIDWNPLHTPEERWKRSQIPTEYSIPPKALQILLELAREQKVLDHANQVAVNAGEHQQLYGQPASLPSTDQSYSDAPKLQLVSPVSEEDDKSEELLKEFGLDLS